MLRGHKLGAQTPLVGMQIGANSLAVPQKVEQNYYKTQELHSEDHMSSPSWFGSVNRASACQLKGSGLDSHQGHLPQLRARPPVGS